MASGAKLSKSKVPLPEISELPWRMRARCTCADPSKDILCREFTAKVMPQLTRQGWSILATMPIGQPGGWRSWQVVTSDACFVGSAGRCITSLAVEKPRRQRSGWQSKPWWAWDVPSHAGDQQQNLQDTQEETVERPPAVVLRGFAPPADTSTTNEEEDEDDSWGGWQTGGHGSRRPVSPDRPPSYHQSHHQHSSEWDDNHWDNGAWSWWSWWSNSSHEWS